MDKKKDLWLALSALGVAASTSTPALAAQEQVGVVNKANVAVEGQMMQNASRVLFIGSDVYHNETVRTDKTGQVHLMFLDQSSLTIGPNSEVVIDHFVYDPKTNEGELSISAAKGILRFVGGALSKSGNVTVKTPLGNLGIRGAVIIVEIDQAGGIVTGCILYGNELNGTSTSGITKSIKIQEECLTLTRSGHIKVLPLSTERLQQILSALQGPPGSVNQPGFQVDLPENYSAWLRELRMQGVRNRIYEDEEFNAMQLNRDADAMASM